MLKVDVEATEAQIRAEWAAIRVQPNMQHDYGQLQSNGYAVDMSVAGTLWAATLPGDSKTDIVMQAAGTMVSSFIANLLRAQAGEELGHDALHLVLFYISKTTHDALGFSDEPEEGLVLTDMLGVMKDVGDA